MRIRLDSGIFCGFSKKLVPRDPRKLFFGIEEISVGVFSLRGRRRVPSCSACAPRRSGLGSPERVYPIRRSIRGIVYGPENRTRNARDAGSSAGAAMSPTSQLIGFVAVIERPGGLRLFDGRIFAYRFITKQ